MCACLVGIPLCVPFLLVKIYQKRIFLCLKESTSDLSLRIGDAMDRRGNLQALLIFVKKSKSAPEEIEVEKAAKCIFCQMDPKSTQERDHRCISLVTIQTNVLRKWPE